MMRRDVVPLLLIALVLGLLGLFAYLSQNPDSGLWERGSRLPLVGEWIGQWHWYYKVEKQRAEGGRASSPAGRDGEVIVETRTEQVVIPSVQEPGAPAKGSGKPSSSAPWVASSDHVWVVPGIEIRAEPRPDAKLLETMKAIANLAYSDRRGDYFKVEHGKTVGWVFLPAYDAGDPKNPPLGSAVEPPGPLPARAPDAGLLAQGRGLLREKERVTKLGPYDLYTDVADPELLALLAGVTAAAEPLYKTRYGRIPVGEARGAILLFSVEGAYRVFQLQSENLLGLSSSGHNSLGLIALYVGDRHRDDVAATLVHELGHLLNRRSLGPALPSWLDEGLCEDLALAKVGPGGQLLPAEVAGRVLRQGNSIDFEGGLTSFFRLRAQLLDHQLPTLRELAALDWRGFVHSEKRRASYDLAGAWVRYLIDGEGAKRAPGFRSFLHSVSSGGQPDLASLYASFTDQEDVVEAGFRVWLLDNANHLLGPP